MSSLSPSVPASNELETLWAARYGTPPPEGAEPRLAGFLGHRSVRHYTGEPVSDGLLATLIAAAQSAATSSNLQLWSVISVDDPDRRARATELTGNQDQVRNAARFLVFVADLARLRTAAHRVGEQAEGLDYQEFTTMAEIDAALAAERLVVAAEAMGLGICYIGAVRNNPPGLAELLDLPEGTFAVFGLCLGWPDPDRPAGVKPRLAQHAVWFRERYDRDPDIAEYDARMRGFYEAQRMKGDVTWSMRSARRVDGQHLTGREILKDWLRRMGMALR